MATTAGKRSKARRAKQDLYRQLILDAAESVFAEKGYDHAKMEEIAREAGLSPGTVYTVFKGKADVFRALHEAGDQELLRRGIEEARGLDDPLETLLAGLRGYVGYFLERPDFLRMHLREGLTWGTEQSGADVRSRTDAWHVGVQAIRTAVQRCMDAGTMYPGDADLVGRMMIAMQQVQLARWVEDGMTRPAKDVLAEVELHVRRAFCTGE